MKRLLEWTTLVGLLGSALLIWLFATGRIGAVAGSQIGDPLIVGFLARDHAVLTFFRALVDACDWVSEALVDLPSSPSVPVKDAQHQESLPVNELLKLGLLLAKDGPSTAEALLVVLGGDTSDAALLALAKAVLKDISDAKASPAPPANDPAPVAEQPAAA